MVAVTCCEGATLFSQLTPAPNFSDPIAMDASLHDLGLSLRVVNALENAKAVPDDEDNVHQVHNVGELLQLTPRNILSIANLGDKTLDEIFLCLAKRGLVKPGEAPPQLTLEERQEKACEQRRTQLRTALAYR